MSDLVELCMTPEVAETIKKLIENKYPKLRVYQMGKDTEDGVEVETWMIMPKSTGR
jgi:hypothetical protein